VSELGDVKQLLDQKAKQIAQQEKYLKKRQREFEKQRVEALNLLE